MGHNSPKKTPRPPPPSAAVLLTGSPPLSERFIQRILDTMHAVVGRPCPDNVDASGPDPRGEVSGNVGEAKLPW